MYILKAGEGCVLKMRLVEANGAPIELRNARFVQAILHLPNEATMLCEDVRFDEVSQLVFVRLSAKDELTMEGVYGININALFDGRRVVTSAVLDFAEVKANAESRYYELLIDLIVSTTDIPSCVKYTGASPKVSENGTWLVFNDEINAFEDTGISIFGKSAYQAAIESGKFSGTEEDFNAYMGSIPQITNDAIFATESANKATENANNAGAEATTAKENAEQATEQAKVATANANSAAQRANEEVQNLREKADTDGSYPDMTVGKAENLVGRGDVQDAQINFRPSAGADNITDGAARIERIKGNSVVYNQLAQPQNKISSGVTCTHIGNGIVELSGTQTSSNVINAFGVYTGISNHKMMSRIEVLSMGNRDSLSVGNVNVYMGRYAFTGVGVAVVFYTLSNANPNYLGVLGEMGLDYTGVKVRMNVIDLTKEFGAGNEPTSYEEYLLRKPMNIEDEFAYNAGTLVDMKVDSLVSVSDNAYDYTKGYARVMGGYKYDITANAGATLVVSFYADGEDDNEEREIAPDSEGKYTFPANGICYVNGDFASRSDVCVCLKHSYDKPHPAYQQEVKDLGWIWEIQYKDGNRLFENGMRDIPKTTHSTRGVCDEILYNPTKKKWKAIKRIERVEGLQWSLTKYPNTFAIRVNGNKEPNDSISYNQRRDGIRSNKYGISYHLNYNTMDDKTMLHLAKALSGYSFFIKDTAYATAAEFNEANKDLVIYYELAEPIVVELDYPTAETNMDYLVWDFGTEEAIASVPSAPFRADINYEPNAVDDLRWAVSEIRILRAELAQLQSGQASETNLTE